MKILAIEASAVAASAAVTEDGRLLAEEFTQTALTHSATLLPMIKSVLNKAGTEIDGIDYVAVTEGPGSFSGLRIGVTTAKTLAYAANKKVIGISTLLTLASSFSYTDRVICPIMDARRDQVYNALYRCTDDGYATIREPRAISAEELSADISSVTDKEVIFVGDAVSRFRDYFRERLGEKALFAPEIYCAARASNVAYLAHKCIGSAVEPEEINPVYLRLSQAEREYIEKNGKE